MPFQYYETYNSIGSIHNLSRQKRLRRNRNNYKTSNSYEIASTISPITAKSITQTTPDSTHSYNTDESRFEYRQPTIKNFREIYADTGPSRQSRPIKLESSTDWWKWSLTDDWSTTEIPEKFKTEALLGWTSTTIQTKTARTKITETQTTRVQTRQVHADRTQQKLTETTRAPMTRVFTRPTRTTRTLRRGQKLTTTKLSFIIIVQRCSVEDDGSNMIGRKIILIF